MESNAKLNSKLRLKLKLKLELSLAKRLVDHLWKKPMHILHQVSWLFLNIKSKIFGKKLVRLGGRGYENEFIEKSGGELQLQNMIFTYMKIRLNQKDEPCSKLRYFRKLS